MCNLLIFAGTSEGRRLVEYLAATSALVTVCVTTPYGRDLLPVSENVRVLVGRLDESQMEELMASQKFDCVIDATHPYAVEATLHAMGAAGRCQLPYLRMLREESKAEGCYYVQSAQDAAQFLNGTQGNVLLTTGSKELAAFTQVENFAQRIYPRVLPTAQVLAHCEELGFPGKNIIAMQGPFTAQLNRAMLSQMDAAWLVTKESGTSGGFAEKIQAAEELGVQVLIIGRPPQQAGYTYDEVISRLERQYALSASRIVEQPHRTVTVVGIGPGSREQMTLAALKAVESCDCLIGAQRMVDAFSYLTCPQFISVSATEIARYITQHSQYQNIVVLASGDVGFYSIASTLKPLVSGCQVRYLCGISSLVYFSGALQIPWQDGVLLSLHGRDSRYVGIVLTHPKTFLLTGGSHSVQEICQTLVDFGMENLTVSVGENLSYPNERIVTLPITQAAQQAFAPLSVLLIENPTPMGSLRVTHGLPDELFDRGDVPMTKSEVRSVSLSKLALRRDDIVYDIGAGTGSVAVEMALMAREGIVYAIEKNPQAVSLLHQNREKFAAYNMRVVEGEAPQALASLPAPDRVFIGGSSGNLDAIVETVLGKNPQARIVLNAITLETLQQGMAVFQAHGLADLDVVQLSVAKARPVGKYHMMTGQNPVFILSGEGREGER